MKKFNHEILFQFLSKEEQDSFMCWENIWISPAETTIIATYISPLSKKIIIPVSDYMDMLRENKIDTIIDNI